MLELLKSSLLGYTHIHMIGLTRKIAECTQEQIVMGIKISRNNIVNNKINLLNDVSGQ